MSEAAATRQVTPLGIVTMIDHDELLSLVNTSMTPPLLARPMATGCSW